MCPWPHPRTVEDVGTPPIHHEGDTMNHRTALTMLATGLAAAALVAPAATSSASPPMPEPPGPTSTEALPTQTCPPWACPTAEPEPEPGATTSVTVTTADDAAWIDEMEAMLARITWPAEWAGGHDVVLVFHVEAGD